MWFVFPLNDFVDCALNNAKCCCGPSLQMLFYESAKCLHGRMSALKGKYYAGFFVHYKVFTSQNHFRHCITITRLLLMFVVSLSMTPFGNGKWTTSSTLFLLFGTMEWSRITGRDGVDRWVRRINTCKQRYTVYCILSVISFHKSCTHVVCMFDEYQCVLDNYHWQSRVRGGSCSCCGQQ